MYPPSLKVALHLLFSLPPSHSDTVNPEISPFISACVFVCLCSAVQEHGARRVNSGLQALLSSGPGEGSEGRLAEETA